MMMWKKMLIIAMIFLTILTLFLVQADLFNQYGIYVSVLLIILNILSIILILKDTKKE